MSNFSKGLLTGLMTGMTEELKTRKTEARDYYQSQLEIARTRGVENRSKVKDQVNASVNVARKLENMGVPRELILARANEDPKALGDFETQITELQASLGRDLQPSDFKELVRIHGSLANPKEDFNSFFNRIYTPTTGILKANPEAKKQSLGSVVWGSLTGAFDPMEKARDKLATTEVEPGLTAAQALGFKDEPVTPPAEVTTSFSPQKQIGLAKEAEVVSDDVSGRDGLTFSTRNAITKRAAEDVKAAKSAQLGKSGPSVGSKDLAVGVFNHLMQTPPSGLTPREEDAYFEAVQAEVARIDPEWQAQAEEAPAPSPAPAGEAAAPTSNTAPPKVLRVKSKGPRGGETILNYVRTAPDGQLIYTDGKRETSVSPERAASLKR